MKLKHFLRNERKKYCWAYVTTKIFRKTRAVTMKKVMVKKTNCHDDSYRGLKFDCVIIDEWHREYDDCWGVNT